MATEETIRQAAPLYLDLQRALSESAWALTALPQIKKRLESAEAAAKVTRDNVSKFDKRSKEQLGRFQNLQHHGVRRAWYRTTGKLDDKLQEEEKAWLKEYELVQAAKARGEEQEKEAQNARRIYEQCLEARKLHERSQEDLKGLLERLFAGPTPSFPSEDEIEQSLLAAQQRLDNATVLIKREQYVVNALRRAHQCLLGSFQALESSLQMNTIDLFTHGGYADWMVHSALAQARDLAARAQFLVAEVRRIEPSIPHLGDIYIEQDNLVFNIIFDNIFTDLRVRQIIEESLSKIQRAMFILQQQVLPEVESRNQSAQAQIESSETEVRRLEKAMWNERVRIMTQVVGEGQSGPRGPREPLYTQRVQRTEVSPTFDVENDEPPPPYSIEEETRRR